MSNSTTPAEPPVLSENEARELTEKIKTNVEALWELIKQAYTRRAWEALDYPSWDAYCDGEFATSRLRLPREERAQIVSSLREAGMTLREIGAAANVSKDTVARDLVSNETADPEPDPWYSTYPTPQPVVIDIAKREPVELDAELTPIDVVWEPAPPRPPVETDYTPNFVMSARSLLQSANAVASLHRHVKSNPGKSFTDGVTAVRQAVDVLQALLADD